MKSVMKLLELRVIAGLGGIGSGVPLLFLRGMNSECSDARMLASRNRRTLG